MMNPRSCRYFLTALLLMVLSLPGHILLAQGAAEWVRAGEMMMREGDMVGAMHCFLKASEQDSADLALNRKLGEAARGARDYPVAARAFDRAALKVAEKHKAELLLQAALMHKQSGDYTSWMQRLLAATQAMRPGDEVMAWRIDQEKASMETVRRLRQDSARVRVWNAGTGINGEYAEISPFLQGDSLLIYASSTPLHPFGEDFHPEEQQFHLLQAAFQAMAIGKPSELGSRLNATGYHNANAVISADGNIMVFTRCDPGIPRQGNCSLWMSRNQRGKWGKPRPLEGVNTSGFSTTHPCLVGMQGKEVLYFASDRPGGLGGWDLWYTVLTKGRPGPVVNLGPPFNTPGDEMAPTATDSSAGLWFSSDGHPGLGGQDLFFSNGGFNQWDRPYNLGLPFNSPADDFWYRPSGPARPGLLVSNRAGSQSHTGETCCYDIYLHRASDKVLLARPPDSLTLVKRLAAERLNALLPLELYFDNDRPDPASTADTTLASYSALLQDYLSRERVFEQAYAAGLSQPEVARDSVRRFMESEVRPSGPKLDSLLRHLAGLLPEGYGVTLVLRGYASPLNTPEYNEKLAGRRVASVRNEMMQWKAGELAVWIGQPDGLRITEVPMGERAGLHNVSDDPADPRNSVYSPAASRERKVSILYGMVDGQTGLWGGIPTTVRLRLTEPMPETLRDGEHRVLRLILANEGTSVFYCRGVSVSDPAAEAVISGNRVEPGQEADLFLLLRGPLGHETPDIRLTVYGNLYEDPYTIVLRNQ